MFHQPIRMVGLLVVLLTPMSAWPASRDTYLPDGTEVVVTLHIRNFLDSPQVQPGLTKLREQIKNVTDAQKELDALGFDPLTDLDSLTAAGVPSRGADQFLLILHGRFDFNKLIARVQEALKDHSDILSTIKEERCQFLAVTLPNRVEPLYIGWPDSATIIASSSKPAMIQAFDIQSGKIKPTVSQAMSDLLDQVDENQVISIACVGDALANTPHAGQIRNITGGVTIDDGLHLSLTVAAKDGEVALPMAKAMTDGVAHARTMIRTMSHERQELAPLVALVDGIKVTTEGDTVILTGEFTPGASDQPAQKPDRPRPKPKRPRGGR
jgi:hypothetical protein